MKYILIFLFALSISACKLEPSTAVNADIFSEKIESGATVIDVRTPEEYATGHITNSVNIDVKNPGFEQNLLMLDKLKTYAVYCASGVRSGSAGDIMSEKGFTSVYTLEGGLKTWKEKGFPLE